MRTRRVRSGRVRFGTYLSFVEESSSFSRWIKTHIGTSLAFEEYVVSLLEGGASVRTVKMSLPEVSVEKHRFSCDSEATGGCKYATSHKGNFRTHVRVHHLGSCLKLFSDLSPRVEAAFAMSQLPIHEFTPGLPQPPSQGISGTDVQIHEQGAKLKIPCPDCSYSATRQDVLAVRSSNHQRHIKRWHSPQEDKAKVNFSLSQELPLISLPHVPILLPFRKKKTTRPHFSFLQKPVPERRRTCPHCKFRSNHKGNLDNHIRVHHAGKTRTS